MSQGWGPKHPFSFVEMPHLMHDLRLGQAFVVLQTCRKEALLSVEAVAARGSAMEELE
jgi:hypothetical protein